MQLINIELKKKKKKESRFDCRYNLHTLQQIQHSLVLDVT